MSQLEVRAKDVLEAVDELDASIEALKEQKITLPREVMPSWIKLKTAGTYLKRLIEKGH